MLIVVAPGQGAQAPGFLAPWLEDSGFAERLTWLSTVAGLDLAHYGTEADADMIRDTAVAQPLLVGAGIAAAPAVLGVTLEGPGVGPGAGPGAGPGVGALAGHSVGELVAAALGGVLSPEQAIVLVRERGRAMAEAAAATPTGMTAVLGGDQDEVLADLERHGLTPANVNAPGQVVAAGTLEQLQALAADPPEKARLMPLQVAGAFHTEHMSPAVAHLERLARAVPGGDPTTPIISNADGAVVTDGPDVVRRLVHQVDRPVRWDLCMETMTSLGVTGLLELPPAGTLTGIAKRALRGVATFALKTPDQLDDARAFVAEHASTPADEATTEGVRP